jgi:uncharacterized membrane protein
MPSQSLARGIFLALVAAYFGLTAMTYRIGDLGRAGPGLFPIIVSGLLFVLAVVTLVQARLNASPPLYFNFKNIALIMGALIGFVLISKHLSMLVAIAFLVFVASYAGTSVSWKRNVQVAIGLMLIAYAFQRFLGLNLRLF